MIDAYWKQLKTIYGSTLGPGGKDRMSQAVHPVALEVHTNRPAAPVGAARAAFGRSIASKTAAFKARHHPKSRKSMEKEPAFIHFRTIFALFSFDSSRSLLMSPCSKCVKASGIGFGCLAAFSAATACGCRGAGRLLSRARKKPPWGACYRRRN